MLINSLFFGLFLRFFGLFFIASFLLEIFLPTLYSSLLLSLTVTISARILTLYTFKAALTQNEITIPSLHQTALSLHHQRK